MDSNIQLLGETGEVTDVWLHSCATMKSNAKVEALDLYCKQRLAYDSV